MSTEDIQADTVLDARGLSCPMPMLKMKKMLKSMQKDQILEVLSTDPGSKNDIPGYCEKQNYKFLGYYDDPEDFTRYYVQT